MRAIEICQHFLSHSPWVDPASTVDRIIWGDPEKDVRKCVVTWISSLSACRAAVERGADLLITHEPTFYDHWDRGVDEPPVAQEKRAFLEKSGLVVLRVHDAWDRFPEIGIPWAWARFLELGQTPAATADRNALHRYDVPGVSFRDFARHVAARTVMVGEPVIQMIGDEAKVVSRIGIGTGCICSIRAFVQMGCDCSIVCDDGSSYWRDLQMAEDMGHPVIRVHHGTAEEPGMVTLARYVNEHVPGVTAEWLPHQPAYRAVGALAPGSADLCRLLASMAY